MKEYNYKKIQEMRAMIIEELRKTFPVVNSDILILAEHRLQSAIMAGLFDSDIKAEVTDNRVRDK